MAHKSEEKEIPGNNPVRKTIPLKGWRQAMAELTLRSHLESAEVTQMREVDTTEMMELRQSIVPAIEKEHGVHVSYTHFLLRAVALALREHPIINSSLVDREIIILENINIGMAVALDNGGLLSPVIHQADKLSLVELAKRANTLVEKVKAARCRLEDLRGATFSVSNAGMYGTDFVTLLLSPHQSAALGVGRVVSKPAVRDNKIVVRSMIGLSLTYDHRVFAGATAAKFFTTLQEFIENPTKLNLGT